MEKHGNRIEVQMNLAPQSMAFIHASELREILTNLVLNAVDAMPGGGVLTMTSKCQEHDVIIEVADNGMGMPEDVQRKIFDPFFTTKGLSNSGLGLSVSWHLVTRYGGDIRVASQIGKGSRFSIRLKRAETNEELAVPQKSAATSGSRKVLLVDDDQEVLRLLRDMIRLSGHKVIAIHDATEALKAVGTEDYDIVLTDLGMPLVSGWEIAREVKKRDPAIPVVLITGWGIQYEGEDLSNQGIDMVIAKPLGYDKLHEIFQKMF